MITSLCCIDTKVPIQNASQSSEFLLPLRYPCIELGSPTKHALDVCRSELLIHISVLVYVTLFTSTLNDIHLFCLVPGTVRFENFQIGNLFRRISNNRVDKIVLVEKTDTLDLF